VTIADFYTRKSTKDIGRSLISQEEECTADIHKESWQLGRIFSDPELSASIFAKKARPDFAELVKHMESGDCQLIVMWEASRGSRDIEEWVHLLGICRRQNILIRIVSHHRTYNVKERRDFKTLVEEGLDAHDESARTSDRTRRTLGSIARAGGRHGRVIFGYDRVYDKQRKYTETVKNKEQAPVVVEIARRVAAGDPLNAIANDLNRDGIPTPTGEGPWRASQVSRIARNPTYVGRRMHHDEFVAEGKWPALLEVNVWATCVELLANPDRRTSASTALMYPLVKVPRCGECGQNNFKTGWITLKAKSRHLRIYRCECARVSVSGTVADDFVARMVKRRWQESDGASLFSPQSREAEVAAAIAEADELTATMEDHYTEAAARRLSAAGLARMESLLLPLIRDAQRRADQASVSPILRDLANIDVVGTWHLLGPAKQRNIVRGLVDLQVNRAVRRGRIFDPWRFADSRWHGDTQTWGDIWTAKPAAVEDL
jgi:site-specific DNA recombinase